MKVPISFNKLPTSPSIDKVGVEERVARFQTRSIKNESKRQGLDLVLSMIDLTTLEGKDTPGKVKQMCYKAHHLHDAYAGVPNIAAVCVYPSMVRIAKTALVGTDVKVASVSTAFPSGQSTREIKIADTKFAVDEGADEIDMVISRGKFLAGEYNFVFDEIASIKEACGKARLKVILETGELDSLDNIRKASDIAIYAGADFIKTSTGKIQPGATLSANLVMLQSIKDYYDKTGIKIGIKPSGGLSSIEVVLPYLEMIRAVLGEHWITNKLVRFGASSLANNALEEILKMQNGKDQSTDYFLFG